MRTQLLVGMFLLGTSVAASSAAAQEFAVASIRPSAEPVKFESDGETKVTTGVVRMRDVTIETCIKWAYRVQKSQVSGPGLLTSERYDIVAKVRGPGQRRTNEADDARPAEGAIQARVPHGKERASLVRPDRHQRQHEAEAGNTRRGALQAELADGDGGSRDDDAGVRRFPVGPG